MKVDLFDFDLPPELIAQKPADPRDSSRLLVVDEDGRLQDQGVLDLPDFLRPGDVMVVNNTKVIPARLFGKRGEAGVEITLHKLNGDGTWSAFAKPAKKLKPEDHVHFSDQLSASVIERDGPEVRLSFNLTGADFQNELERVGQMPLPPYIKRETGGDDADTSDYQTAFAEKEGAVAAPTASLHFTERLLSALDARGVQRATLTLHVGAGTFLPVKSDNTEDHKMHAEWGEVSQEAAEMINKARENGGRVLACGSTAMRLLETAADETGKVSPFQGDTDIFITPGYRFKVCDLMLTNFHLPKSTLVMLVSAFSGIEEIQQAYAHAVAKNYRFFSYGDACLLHRRKTY